MTGSRATPEQVKRFFHLARQVGITAACAEIKVSRQTGRRWLRAGEKRALRITAAAKVHDASVRELVAANPEIGPSEIGRAIKVTRQRASAILKRMRNGRTA